MSVPSSTTWIQAALTSVPQTIPVTFVFQNSSDLLVLDSKTSPPTTLIQNSDYTVTGGSGSVGNVTLIAGGTNAVKVGDVITISRRVPLTQSEAFPPGGPATPQMVGRALDKLTELAQQVNLLAGNSLQFQGDESPSPAFSVLPLAARKNAFLAFDINGHPSFLNAASIVSSVAAPLAVSSIQALRAVLITPVTNGAPVNVLGYYVAGDGGGGPIRYLSKGQAPGTYTDNGSSVIVPIGGDGSAAWLWETSGLVNVRWFGAKGNAIADDTATLQAAIDYCGASATGCLYIPAGRYITNTLTLVRNLVVFGDGKGATTLLQNTVTGASYGLFYANSGAAGTQLQNITIAQMTIDGQVVSAGFSQFKHLVSLNGVKDATIMEVEFLGPCGDGLYIGSGVNGGDERHNTNVVVSNCVFDGVNNDNRNGISVIDCDGMVISNSKFLNLTKATMPGAIDLEPDANAFHVLRDITISKCQFSDIGGIGAVINLTLSAANFTTKPSGFRIVDCFMDTFDFAAVNISGYAPSAITNGTETVDLQVVGLRAKNGNLGVTMTGVNGVLVERSTFTDFLNSHNVGFTAAANFCIGVRFLNCTMTRMGSSSGNGLAAFGVSDLQIEGCRFIDCGTGVAGSANAIDFNTGTSDNVRIVRNVFAAPTAKTTIAIQKEAGHTFTEGTNLDASNQFNSLTNNFVASGASAMPNGYATASWTPTIEGDGGTNANTYSEQEGWYTRIGNVVLAWFNVTMTAKDAGMAGGAQIGGLPIAASGVIGFFASGISSFAQINYDETTVADLGLEVVQTLTKARLMGSGDNTGRQQIVAASISATTSIRGFLIYRI